MVKTIQSVFRRLLRLNVISIFVPLLAIVGIIWVISLVFAFPTIWSAIAAAVVAVLVAVFQIVQGFPLKSTKSRQEMDRLIQLYKGVRYYTSPSGEKTRNMGSVRTSMQSQAQRAEYTPKEIASFLLSLDEGERIVGLAILSHLEKNGHEDVGYFEQTLPLMNEPRSPFEHSLTLERLKMMWPNLKLAQQERLWGDVRSHTRDWHASNSNTSEEWGEFYQWIEEKFRESLKNVKLRNGGYFEQVLKLMNEPCSAYRHYLTLEILKMMWPDLESAQQARLRRNVRRHSRDWYTPNSNISKEWGEFYQWIDTQ